MKLQCGLTLFQLQHCLGRMTVIRKSSGKHDTVSSLLRRFSLLSSLAVNYFWEPCYKTVSESADGHTQHSRSRCNLPGLLIKQIYLASMPDGEPEFLIQPASFPAFQTQNKYTQQHTHTGTLKETCKRVPQFGTSHLFYYSLFTFSQALKCRLNKGKIFSGSYFLTRPAIMLYHLWEGSAVNALNYMTLCWNWVAAWGGVRRSKALSRVMVMMQVIVVVLGIMNVGMMGGESHLGKIVAWWGRAENVTVMMIML